MRQGEGNPGHVLIIGSGVGGLTAGIILARLGLPVTVVEKNPLPGGLMRSYRRSGIECPVGVHYLGALAPGQPLHRLWEYLGVTASIPLERMGQAGVIDQYLFDDFAFSLPPGIDAFEESLRCAFPLEQYQITTIIADLRETSRSLAMFDIFFAPAETFWAPERFASMGERLERLGCSVRLKSVLGVTATLIGVPLRECPVFYYYMTLASYLMSSWRLAGSGTGMAEALAARFRSLGGQIVTGDGVERIAVEGRRVEGVTLRSGRCLAAETIIAALHPATVISLLPPETVRPTYRERVAQMKNTPGLLGLNVAVAGRDALPHNVYRLYPEPDGSLQRGIFQQLRPSGQTGTNLLSMITTSNIEEWQPWVQTVSGRRGSAYEEVKRERARRLLEEAATLWGPFRETTILDIYTPLTIRDMVGSPEGSAYGILRSAGQLLKAASLHRTSIGGLVLAGQNRMASGIMGTMLGSFHAVRQIIGHERFSRDVAGRLR